VEVALQQMTDHTTTMRQVASCKHKQLPLVTYFRTVMPDDVK